MHVDSKRNLDEKSNNAAQLKSKKLLSRKYYGDDMSYANVRNIV